MFVTILFYVFALGLLFSAVKVVTAKNPVEAVLWLVLTFGFSALEWVLMEADFLGIVLLLVYVGAVMVLFLFVVMMLNIDAETVRAGFWRHLPVSLAIGLLLTVFLILIFISPETRLNTLNAIENLPADYNSVRAFGRLLFTNEYIIAFELAAVLLLLGMISAIALAHHPITFGQRKRMNPKDQVKVDPKVGRIEILPMNAEKDEAESTAKRAGKRSAKGKKEEKK